MKRFIRACIVVLMLAVSCQSTATEITRSKTQKPAQSKFLKPPKKIETLAIKLAYDDFPKAVDILAIARGESSYKPDAFNPEKSKINPNRKIPPSRGVMQVQGGSFDLKKNMRQGTQRLRTYYVDECDRSIECAVKSYNVGPRGYREGRAKVDQAKYWANYRKNRQDLVDHYRKIGDYKLIM